MARDQKETIEMVLEVYPSIERAYEGVVESGLIDECHKLIQSEGRAKIAPLVVDVLSNASYLYSKRSERPPSEEHLKVVFHRYLTQMFGSGLFNRRELEFVNAEYSRLKSAFDELSDWFNYGESITGNKRSALRSNFFAIGSSITEIYDYFTEIVEAIEDGEIVAEEE